MTPLTFLQRLTFNKLRAILEFMNCYAIELPLDEAQESFDHSMSQASLVTCYPHRQSPKRALAKAVFTAS